MNDISQKFMEVTVMQAVINNTNRDLGMELRNEMGSEFYLCKATRRLYKEIKHVMKTQGTTVAIDFIAQYIEENKKIELKPYETIYLSRTKSVVFWSKNFGCGCIILMKNGYAFLKPWGSIKIESDNNFTCIQFR